jgi:uncharacterized protein YwgA
MLTREETLLLLLFTSPTAQGTLPAIVGSTRLQKLVFLATRESPILAQHCRERHDFVAYDFGPYSNRLERDVENLAGQGMIYFPGQLPVLRQLKTSRLSTWSETCSVQLPIQP